jgi:hypothetical protein
MGNISPSIGLRGAPYTDSKPSKPIRPLNSADMAGILSLCLYDAEGSTMSRNLRRQGGCIKADGEGKQDYWISTRAFANGVPGSHMRRALATRQYPSVDDSTAWLLAKGTVEMRDTISFHPSYVLQISISTYIVLVGTLSCQESEIDRGRASSAFFSFLSSLSVS